MDTSTLGIQLEDWRIRTHLRLVEQRLRARDVSDLSAPLHAARQHNLDRLHEYWTAGIFPRNTEGRYWYTPSFIDQRGRTCAVADLMVQSGVDALAKRVDQVYHNAYVRQMQMPDLELWAAQSGLTVDELALIQPGYGAFGLIFWGGMMCGPVFLVLSLINLALHANNVRILASKNTYHRSRASAIASIVVSLGLVLTYIFFMYMGNGFGRGGDSLGVLIVLIVALAVLWAVNFRSWQSSQAVLKKLAKHRPAHR